MKRFAPLASLILALGFLAPAAEAGGASLQIGLGHGRPRVELQAWSSNMGRQHSYGRDRYRPVRSCRQERGYQRAPQRVWVPGGWEVVQRRVWVPGSSHQVWVPATYETRYDAWGRPFRSLVAVGHYETVCSPGRWELRNEQVWREPHWETR